MKYKALFLIVFLFSIPFVSYADVVRRDSTIEEKLRATFWDEPRMLAVIECESHFVHFKSNGKVLRSKTSDIGVMQINQVHWQEARSLGLDIWNSENDNIIMGRIIYDKQGIKAWTCNKLV